MRAECLTSPDASDVNRIKDKLRKLVNDIGMKVFMDPNVIYMPDQGNEGMTGIIGLETSHSSFHYWDMPHKDYLNTEQSKTLANADIYTCGCLGVTEIQGFLNFYHEFNPVLLTAKIVDRSIPSMPTIHKFKYDARKDGDFKSFVENLNLEYTESYKKLLSKKAA